MPKTPGSLAQKLEPPHIPPAPASCCCGAALAKVQPQPSNLDPRSQLGSTRKLRKSLDSLTPSLSLLDRNRNQL
jgi:hypothetical protein